MGGKLLPIPVLTEVQISNFWAKVEPTGFCWNWTAMKTRDGYGRFAVDSRHSRLAHRIAYTLLVGEVPSGLELDHLCRNKACVNPDHLEPVTQSENMRRIPLGARNLPHGGRPPWVVSGKNVTGFCKHGHEYTDENTYVYPDGRTECRVCKRGRKRKGALVSVGISDES